MRYLFGFLCVCALGMVPLVGCSETTGDGGAGGSAGSGGMGGGGCAEPEADVTGEWKIDATPMTDTCGGSLAPYTFFITAVQEGNAVTSETPEGPMTGTMCGDQLRLSGSWTEAGVAQTVNLELTVSIDGNSAEGSDAWTWTDGTRSCGGSESLSATRIDAAVCGDNVVEPSEQCDGVDLQGLDCTDFDFTGGTLACTPECTFDTSGCTGPVCGDNIAEGTEVCDGTDLAGLTCADFGFTGETLACLSDCSGFDTSSCCVYGAQEQDAITCINGEAPTTDAGTVYFNAENCADAANTVYDLTLANADGVTEIYMWVGVQNGNCQLAANRSVVQLLCRPMASNPRIVGDNVTVFDLTLQELVDTGIVDCTALEGQHYEIYSFRNEDPGGVDVPPDSYGVAPFKVGVGTGGSGGTGGTGGGGNVGGFG